MDNLTMVDFVYKYNEAIKMLRDLVLALDGNPMIEGVGEKEAKCNAAIFLLHNDPTYSHILHKQLDAEEAKLRNQTKENKNDQE